MTHPTPPINQKLIATEAGVSQSTVSLVLTGRGLIAEKTRRRVLATADRLKYRPNLLVHGMQTGRTRTMGVMMPPVDSYWSQVLYGIHDTLSAADFVPIMLWAPHDIRGQAGTGRHVPNELDQIHRLLDRRVDGVILWPAVATVYGDRIHEFSSRDLPIVTIDHELAPEYRAAYVGSDEADGGRLVARHLHQLGHRRVGCLAGPSSETWARLRQDAFVSAFGALPGTECVVAEARPGLPAQAIAQARTLVAQVPPLSAIYAATDIYAKLVYQAAAERAMRIPEDLSVVGFSDDDFAAEMSPPLTTVRQPAYDIGATAAAALLRLAEQGLTMPGPLMPGPMVPGPFMQAHKEGPPVGRLHEELHEELPVLICVRGSTAPIEAPAVMTFPAGTSPRPLSAGASGMNVGNRLKNLVKPPRRGATFSEINAEIK